MTQLERADILEHAVRQAVEELNGTASPKAKRALAILIKALSDQHGRGAEKAP